MSSTASVTNLASLLSTALAEAGDRSMPRPSAQEVESATFLVFYAMTASSRNYHGLDHIFTVGAGLSALGRLAAIFHDVVYFKVDGGFPPHVEERIGDVIEQRNGRVYLTATPEAMVSELATIFDFKAGQELNPYGGLNEFLSAALAIRELKRFLNKKDLWAVAACIELTIPFRKTMAGCSPSVRLGKRLELLCDGNTKLSRDEIDSILALAVQMANTDLHSFSEPELSRFLENTWKLLPEINPDFQTVGTYTIGEYCRSLMRMENFLTNLDPGVIFHQHNATPDIDTLNTLNTLATFNLRYASEYLRAKIVTMSVLQGIAELTGCDGPISYFTGAANSDQPQIHDLLQPPELSTTASPPELKVHVLQILQNGRSGTIQFDTSSSPLAAYFYRLLGSVEITRQAGRVREVYAGKQDWAWLLSDLPRAMVDDVAAAIGTIAIARQDSIRNFLSR